MKPLERQLRAFLGAIVDECKSNPAFADRLAAALGVVSSESQDHEGEGAGGRRPARRALGPVDPFEVFRDAGPEALLARLHALELEQLKDIIAEHSMDNSRLAMKWKSKERLAQFIVDKVAARSRKGEAFLGGDFEIRPDDGEYVRSWNAVIIPVELTNRGRPDTITSIHLRVANDSFASSAPDPGREVPRIIGPVPRRFEANDGFIGVLYFGPGRDDGRAVPFADTAELVIQRASGAVHRVPVKLRARPPA